MRSLLSLGLAAGLLGAFAPASPAHTLLHVGTLIDGVSDTPRSKATIVIDGERITAIADGFSVPAAGDTVINLENETVTPGWIDCHVHLDDETTAHALADEVQMNAPDYAYLAVANARKTLLGGFTTVRNVGDHFNSTIALRNAIRKGLVIGPRVFSAGAPIGTTGGHADSTDGLSKEIMEHLPNESVINGPDEARRAVRQHYKDGADLIKIMTSAGVLSMETSADNAQMDMDEIVAVVTTAHEYGLKVAVHAHGAEAIRRAVVGGVDSIEHGTYMSDEDITLMKQHGTYYVPTLTAGMWTLEKSKIPGFFPEIIRVKAAVVGLQMIATFHKAYLAGVKIAFGTDTGVSEHGENAQEFQYMVQGGMPPMKAIQAGTREAATLIGCLKDAGTIEPGKYADFTGVPGDLLSDISLVRKVAFVMKGGVVYKTP